MLKYVFLLMVLVVVSSAAMGQAVDYSRVYMPAEIRAVWIDAGAIPKTQSGVRELVKSYARANFNVLFPETIMRGYSIYPSKLIARDPRFANAPDVLAIMIDEAHKHGMEVHPWVWVFRAGYTKDRGSVLTQHPDWAERGKNGEELSPNGGLWISPAVPAARNFIASLFAELASCYNIDGLHLDYIRYEVENGIPYGYSDASRAAFEKHYGIDPMNVLRLSIHKYEWNKFRERQINTFVQRIALQTRGIRPHAKISAAVGSDPGSSRLELMQNWANWVDNKWVDFLTPMAYSTDDPYFRKIVNAELEAACGKSMIAPGIGSFAQKSFDQSIKQIGMARQMGASGESFFAASYLHEAQLNALAKGPYAQKAKLPFRHPQEVTKDFSDCAAAAKNKGSNELWSLYCNQAAAIADYARYHSSDVPYMHPSAPPLSTPGYIIPLPEARIPGASGTVKIDGDLDDPAWQNAAKAKLEYDENGGLAAVDTTALITYDSRNLYIAFECAEPETSKIRAAVTKPDGPVFSDDSVEVFIDPAGNQKLYYHFAANTLGTRFDENVTNSSWNAEWQSRSIVEKSGWTTEIAIPFKALGLSPQRGLKMSMNLTRTRTVTGKAQYTTWAVPYGSFHSPDRFAEVVLD